MFSRKIQAGFLAEVVFVVHILVAFYILFGWVLSGLYTYVYIVVLLITIGSSILYGRCPLTMLEYYLRVKAGQPWVGQATFFTYWGNKMLGKHTPSDNFITRAVSVYLSAQLVIQLVAILRWNLFLF